MYQFVIFMQNSTPGPPQKLHNPGSHFLENLPQLQVLLPLHKHAFARQFL